jgi:hypothetical protein
MKKNKITKEHNAKNSVSPKKKKRDKKLRLTLNK